MNIASAMKNSNSDLLEINIGIDQGIKEVEKIEVDQGIEEDDNFIFYFFIFFVIFFLYHFFISLFFYIFLYFIF